jgi:hypothetical protein
VERGQPVLDETTAHTEPSGEEVRHRKSEIERERELRERVR